MPSNILRATAAGPRRIRRRLGQVSRVLRAERDGSSNALSGWFGDRFLGARLGYLFIVTYGRSGSTLLQGILNSIPGYVIRGENRAMMDLLFDYHMTAKNEQTRLDEPVRLTPTHPFYGIEGYRDEAAYRAIRQLALETILRPSRRTRVVGFKEIRWDEQPSLAGYIEFLREVFPHARFVFNTRNHEDVSQSKWWAYSEDAREDLDRMERRLLALADDLDGSAFHVHYDDYVNDPRSLRDLFDWLDEEFDEEQVREVMARPHSY